MRILFRHEKLPTSEQGKPAKSSKVDNSGNAYAAHRHRAIFLGIACVIVLLALFVICLGIGRYPMSAQAVIESMLQRFFGLSLGMSDTDMTVVCDIRLPVLIAAVLVGAALSVSGTTYQGLFQNPMVSPDILGASAGAAFGASFALLANLPNGYVQAFGFIGGFVAVCVTYFSSKYVSRGVNQILILVLTGLIVQTLFRSLVEAIKYVADPYTTLPEITYWLMGSISKVTWDSIAVFLVPFFIGVIPILVLRWRINTLALGDDEAKALGMNVGVTRGLLIFCATLLTSAVVAIAGIVGWVGLIIPHLTRFMFGQDNRMVVPMSAVVGACFMIVVSTACSSLIATEIPLGILTSIIGAPFFFIILLRARKGGVF